MLSDKFVKKYMRLAKVVGEDDNPCYSRQLGAVIVDPIKNRIISTGYNGPPKGCYHTDHKEYYKQILLPQLTHVEKEKFIGAANCSSNKDFDEQLEDSCNKLHDCKQCPRKLLGYKSGERLEACSCIHCEVNAITGASGDLHGSYMFIWDIPPCLECSKLIINVGIKKLFLVEAPAYNPVSETLLKMGDVEIVKHPKEFYVQL